MITDSPPASARAKKQFDASDALTRIDLPDAAELQRVSQAFQAALETGEVEPVQAAGDALLSLLAHFYEIDPPGLTILGSRPHKSFEDGGSWELFGDYDLERRTIRAWMRTAKLGKVTSYRGFLNTLLHEFCHHLDCVSLGFAETPHTRGFYARVDDLYHLALATPPDKRKPLVWIRMGKAWRVDWRRLR